MLFLSADADAGPTLSSHRAAYSLQLDATDRGSKVIAVDGAISYEFSDTCDGWAVEQRYLMRVLRVEGPEFVIATTFVSWEAKDGSRYRFNVRRQRDGVPQTISGEATIRADRDGGRVRFDTPETKDMELPSGTVFPTSHTLALLSAAVEGRRFDRQIVFDGTEVAGAAPIFATILVQRPSPDGAKISEPLGPHPVWPMFLSFYGEDSREELPEFEMTMLIQENGVATGLDFEYGDFSVKGILDTAEPLPLPAC